LNGTTYLNPATALEDNAVDLLYGNTGTDWFLYTGTGSLKHDSIFDLAAGEIATAINGPP
jgi:hypothetical protein